MQINGVLSGLTDTTLLGKRAETTTAASRRTGASETERASSPALADVSVVREVLTEYDVHNITPQQFTEMVQKLDDAGVLQEADMQQLGVIRQELDQMGIASDEPVDLVTLFSEKLENLQLQASETSDADAAQSEALAQALSTTQRQLDWLEKLSVMQENRDMLGLDTVA